MKKSIITLILTSIISISYADNGINLNCQDMGWLTTSKGGKLSGDGNFYVDNNTGVAQPIRYAITVCSPIRECKTTDVNTIAPPGFFVSLPIGVTMHTVYSNYGSVYYDVYFSFWGFKSMHAEKRCILRITT